MSLIPGLETFREAPLVGVYSNRTGRFRNVSITPGQTSGGGGGGGGGGTFGAEGWAPDIAFDVNNHVNVSSITDLMATYNGGAVGPGTTIFIAYGTYEQLGGNLTFGKSGTAAAPIVIRPGRYDTGLARIVEPDKSATSGFFPDSAHLTATKTFTGLVTVTGNYHVFRGFRFAGDNGGVIVRGTAYDATGKVACNRWNRCFFDGGTSTVNGAASRALDQGKSAWFDWCEWGNAFRGLALRHDPSGGSKGSRVYRCWFHDQNDPNAAQNNQRTLQMIGESRGDSTLDSDHLSLECLYTDAGTAKGGWECKTTNARNERCATLAGGGFVPRVYFRHGQNGIICALYSEGSTGFMEGRGKGHRFADSVLAPGASARSWGPAAGDVTYDGWLAGRGTYPSGADFVLTNIAVPVIGDNTGNLGSAALPTGTTLESCGSPSFLNGASRADCTFTTATTPYRRELPGKAAVKWDVARVGPNGRYDPNA